MHKLIINGYQVGNVEPHRSTLHKVAKNKPGAAYTVNTDTDKLSSRRVGNKWSRR